MSNYRFPATRYRREIREESENQLSENARYHIRTYAVDTGIAVVQLVNHQDEEFNPVIELRMHPAEKYADQPVSNYELYRHLGVDQDSDPIYQCQRIDNATDKWFTLLKEYIRDPDHKLDEFSDGKD